MLLRHIKQNAIFEEYTLVTYFIFLLQGTQIMVMIMDIMVMIMDIMVMIMGTMIMIMDMTVVIIMVIMDMIMVMIMEDINHIIITDIYSSVYCATVN